MHAVARSAILAALGLSLAACGASNRLKNIGETPALSAIDNPQLTPNYKPVSLPMPEPQPASYSPNSLWRTGSRAFFKDQRAARIGDILTVSVKITDQAKVENTTGATRSATDTMGTTGLFGLENAIGSTGANPNSLVGLNSATNNQGKGTVNRQEQIVTNVAALVTQILPNGNMVIEGKQEVRINNEVRELIVAGVVRPEDIDSGNTIDSAKIAFARIGYGGRGQLSELQKPRWGQQFFDAILPW